MKILICGDRNWSDKDIIFRALSKFPKDSVVIHGNARGADKLGAECALEIGMSVTAYTAKWAIYKRAAGVIRNQQMLDDNKDIDLVLAFHKDIGSSRGTKDMVTRAAIKNIKTIIVEK